MYLLFSAKKKKEEEKEKKKIRKDFEKRVGRRFARFHRQTETLPRKCFLKNEERDRARSVISLEAAISAPINTFYNGGPYLHPLRFISPIETFYVRPGYRRRIDDSATNALANRIVDLLLIDRGNYQSTPYFFLSIVPANERGKTKEVEENKHSKIDREFRRCKWNPIAYPRSARACVCACVYVCVRSTRNHQDICTCVRSWTTTKDTRVKTGTKFTLVDTFSATKSRRLRFRGSPPNPNTIGQGMEVLTQEMRSSGVISLRRDGASVVDSEDVSLARSKPFKFPVRVVERWYVVARVRGCDVLVMYFRSIEIWIDRPRSASSDRYDFSFRHCSFAWSQ